MKLKSKMGNNKVYKWFLTGNVRMFPSDPTGSLDDFIFKKCFSAEESLWKKH